MGFAKSFDTKTGHISVYLYYTKYDMYVVCVHFIKSKLKKKQKNIHSGVQIKYTES